MPPFAGQDLIGSVSCLISAFPLCLEREESGIGAINIDCRQVCHCIPSDAQSYWLSCNSHICIIVCISSAGCSVNQNAEQPLWPLLLATMAFPGSAGSGCQILGQAGQEQPIKTACWVLNMPSLCCKVCLGVSAHERGDKT